MISYKLAVYLASFPLLLCHVSFGQSKAEIVGILNTRADSFEAHNLSVFDALLQLGERYKLPIGIVATSAEIMSVPQSMEVRDQTVEGVLGSIVSEAQGYVWENTGEVIVVHPALAPQLTTELLGTTIASYDAVPGTVTELSNQLWMDFQMKLDPSRQGFAGVLHNRDKQIIGPIRLRNVPVEKVLDRIVAQRGAAWVVLPPPPKLVNAPEQALWAIIVYQDPPVDVSQLCCLNRAALPR